MARTSIEWTAGEDGSLGVSWNPVRGCARTSPGCKSCYAERQAARFCGPGEPYEGLITVRSKASGIRYTDPKAAGGWTQPRWTGTARFVPNMLEAPLRWKRARHVFVNSMSDLFHSDIGDEQIAAIFGVMSACQRHTFQVLTKRPERMVEWFQWAETHGAGYDMLRGDMPNGLLTCAWEACSGDAWEDIEPPDDWVTPDIATFGGCWPLPHVWIGVSIEDQQRATERIPLLRQTPAAIRWLSVEPLLERVLLELDGIDWVVVGGESGPRARQCDRRWIEDVVQQCRRAGVPVFVKQLGANYADPENAVGGSQTPRMPEFGPITRLKDRKGADMNEWPTALRIRERPSANRRFAVANNAALHSNDVNFGGM